MPPAAPAYPALALDLDGTLLDDVGTLLPTIRDGVRDLRAAGVGVFLFSGRMQPAVLPIWETLGLDTEIVSYNGAKIARPGETPLFEASLPADVAKRVVRYALDKRLHLNLYADDKLFIFEENELARGYSDYFKIPLNILAPGDLGPAARPTKMLVIVDEKNLEETETALRAAFDGNASLTTSSRRYVEILPRGASKGAALSRMAERHGIPPSRWVAVGDGMNDLEMIRAAGVGVAVENGDEALRAAADRVVPPLPRGGWADLARLVLGP